METDSPECIIVITLLSLIVTMSDQLLTVKETAEYLKVHPQSVRRYIKAKKLKSLKVGRHIRIIQSELERFIHLKQKTKEKVEIELRYLLKDHKALEKRLIDSKAKIIYHSHIIDHWFVKKSMKNFDQQDKLYRAGKIFIVRIREKDDRYKGKISTSFEVKRLTKFLNPESSLEAEIEVQSYEEIKALLNLLDLKEFIVIDKDRVIYQYKDIKVIIDDIKDFSTGVELEILTTKYEKETLKYLEKLAIELGLKKKDRISGGIGWLAMKELSVF